MAENALDRDFDPAKPNTSWVADVTDVPTRAGWLDLAVLVDLFSRLVVGWSMAATMASRLVTALEMALSGRPKGLSGLVAHSDRGSQSASDQGRRRLEKGADRVQREPPQELLFTTRRGSRSSRA